MGTPERKPHPADRGRDVQPEPLTRGDAEAIAAAEPRPPWRGHDIEVDAARSTARGRGWPGRRDRSACSSMCRNDEPEPECGVAADFLVGSRAGLAIALDHKRAHMLSAMLGLGWGTVGDTVGVPSRSGLVISPVVVCCELWPTR